MSNRTDWLLFVLLSFLWGSSYLFIKIGVDAGLAPFTLVTLRLLTGAVMLGIVVAVARERLPRDPSTYGHLVVMSVLSVALPFSLITWAEQSVGSALAAILTAPIPLFVILISAFVLNEAITLNRVAGLVIGLVGVAILVGFDPADFANGTLIAEVALIGAAISYAAGGVYAKRTMHGLRPMIPALFQVTFALVIAGVLALVFERQAELSLTPQSLFAVLWLGLLGSGLAYLVFFRLLERWGATRTSMVAYLIPVFGIVLGALVLSEPIDARLLIGTALVIGGIFLVNSRYGSRPLFARRRQVAEGAER